MKLLIALLMMGMTAGAWGQVQKSDEWPQVVSVKIIGVGNLLCKDNQHIEGDGKSEKGNHCVDDKPLKCGKYQHVEPSRLGCAVGDDVGYCDRIIPAQCADDMHMVTEREWQSVTHSVDLLRKLNDVQAARLKLLEEQQLDIRAFAQGVIAGATQTRKP